MATKVLSVSDAQGAKLDVIADGTKGDQAVHDVVTALRANRRQGNACTKTRGEVKHSNKKPWRQKGTGRARAGRTSSPIWRGGGVAFGPRPRDYSKDVNKKTRRLAFRRALGARIEDGDVIASTDFAVSDAKTKTFVKQVSALIDSDRVLLIGEKFDENTFLAGRNVKSVLLMTADEVNVEQLLYYKKIVVTDSAMETLARRTKA